MSNAKGPQTTPSRKATIADTLLFYLVREERRHQQAKGYTEDHDDTHDDGIIAGGAAAYLYAGNLQSKSPELSLETIKKASCHLWPFNSLEHFQPEKTAAETIIKGIAMALAELERLSRLGEVPGRLLPVLEGRDGLALFDALVRRVRDAEAKHPTDGNPMLAAHSEEHGELAEALLDFDKSRVVHEALDCAAVAMRIAADGDPTLEPHRREKGLGAWHAPNPPFSYSAL